jgi:HD superfamily phosphohydrolase
MVVAMKDHVINDPIHKTMEFSSEEKEWIKPIIDHPLFQRLRHIKQLGLKDFVYPGATHSRFNHCIGACYISGQIADQLEISSKDKKILMKALLLHDIGHGPFSHAFEALTIRSKEKVKHENWTASFLKSFRKDKLFDQDEERLLLKLIFGKVESKDQLLKDIVSSQLDADRFDYLLRDSHFCGVSYGTFDLKWLIHCLAKVDDVGEGTRLGIVKKGIGIVEHYIMARRFMHVNVYLHGKARAVEFLMQRFLVLAETSLNEIKQELGEDLFNFLKIVKRWKKSEMNTKEFLKQGFEFYANLTDGAVWEAIRRIERKPSVKSQQLREICRSLQKRILPKVYSISSENIEAVSMLVSKWKKEIKLDVSEDWKLFVDRDVIKSYKTDDESIFVKDDKGVGHNIFRVSTVMNLFGDRQEKMAFLFIAKDDPKIKKKYKKMEIELNDKQLISSKTEPQVKAANSKTRRA